MSLVKTSNIKIGSVENYVLPISPTSGMPISLQDFKNHHWTSDAVRYYEGCHVVLPTSIEAIGQMGGLITAVGAWSEYDNIEDFINEIYKMREKSGDRTVDL